MYSELLAPTLAAIDVANQQDPNRVEVAGVSWPVELLYGQRMSSCLNQYFPDAAEALQLAARGQHICRWEIPRADYPMDKKGYYAWRNRLKVFHGEKVGSIMAEIGYTVPMIERVKALLSKKFLKEDPETQALEDVICLVFLQYYLEEFAGKHAEEKVVDILRKTWRKMSVEGQQFALTLELKPTLGVLVTKALA